MSEMTTEQNPSEKGGNVARLVDRLSKDISLMSSGTSANGSAQKGDALLRKAQHNQSAARGQTPNSPVAKATAASANSLRRVVANFAYAAQMEDELDLCEGDELAVLEDVEDGWARGRITYSTNATSRGRVGLFPTNFVVPPGQSPKGRAPSESAAITAPNKSRSTTPPLTAGPALGATSNASPKFKEVAKVLYKYEAANPDELSLPEGALVNVLNKNCEDDGWYEGELNGQRGLFPENFVQLLPPVLMDGSAPSTTTVTPTAASNGKSAPTSPLTSPSASDSFTSPLQPPTLPAKPSKTGALFGTKVGTSTTTTANNQPPTARFRDSMSAGPVSKSDTSTKKLGDERKSMIAGLQSKLFGSGGAPLGGFAPHKPGQLGKRDGSPSSVASTAAAETTATDDDTANSTSDEMRLESVTKNRPKQANKRPPSLSSQRMSLMQPQKQKNQNAPSVPLKPLQKQNETSAPSSPVIPPSSNAGSFEKPSSPGVPTKPSKLTAFQALSSFIDVDETSTTNLPKSAAKLDKADKRNSSSQADLGLEPSFVSRVEFNAYRADADARIQKLQRQVAELSAALKTNTTK